MAFAPMIDVPPSPLYPVGDVLREAIQQRKSKPAVIAINHNDFITEPPSEAGRFWIDQILPQEGTVLLWGPTSVGKSPISWQMALSIANGTPFFTHPVQKGRVLYIELDTPKNLVHERVCKLPPAPGLRWVFSQPLSIGSPEWQALGEESRVFQPEVVFINTLRKAYNLPDKDSETPSKVYGSFQRLFPGATLVFVHHARKASTDAENGAPAREGFAGSQAWQNDAQVALYLHRSERHQPEAGEGSFISLEITKTQVSAEGEFVELFLGSDGVTLTLAGRSIVRAFILENPKAPIQEVMDNTGVSRSTVMRVKAEMKRSVMVSPSIHKEG